MEIEFIPYFEIAFITYYGWLHRNWWLHSVMCNVDYIFEFIPYFEMWKIWTSSKLPLLPYFETTPTHGREFDWETIPRERCLQRNWISNLSYRRICAPNTHCKNHNFPFDTQNAAAQCTALFRSAKDELYGQLFDSALNEQCSKAATFKNCLIDRIFYNCFWSSPIY